MLTPAPTPYGFSAEFPGNDPAYDEFDQYLQEEFVNLHPGWDPKFGKASSYDPEVNRYDYLYLLHGNVPEASSHEDAERRVRELVDRVARRVKGAIPKPRIRVWKWH